MQHTFPIHLGNDDTEVILHPGLLLSDTIKAIQKSRLSTFLKVPKFFDNSHGHVYGGHGSVRTYLGDQGQGQGQHVMTTPAQAASIGSFDEKNRETIYCSVASYRDPECAATVQDLYARAARPERIRVAILDQRVDGDAVCSHPETVETRGFSARKLGG
jgi:hypothetical protein